MIINKWLSQILSSINLLPFRKHLYQPLNSAPLRLCVRLFHSSRFAPLRLCVRSFQSLNFAPLRLFVPIFHSSPFAPLRLCVLFITFNASAQFAPPAGQPGTTAIHKDSSAIIAWASGIEVSRGLINISDPSQTHEGSNYASFGVSENALGPAEGTSENVVSLGDGGVATLTFTKPIKNGPGPDFCIFENSFSDTYLELAFVEVSSDGIRFVRFPAISLTQTDEQINAFGALDATKIHNLAGKYRQVYGTPFDLEDLIDSTDIDLNNITHVRIIDVVGSINPSYGTTDSQGNFINDLFPTPFFSGGFDLDAVGVIHEQNEVNLIENEIFTIEIYPNPATNFFYLHCSSEVQKSQIRIVDVYGKVIDFQFNRDLYTK